MSAARTLGEKAGGYFVVGGLAALVDLGAFHWLSTYIDSIVLAAAASFIVAAAFNYSLASMFVYRTRFSSRRAAMFLLGATLGLAVNASTTGILAHALGIAPVLAKMGGIGTAFALNFLVNTFVVFRD